MVVGVPIGTDDFLMERETEVVRDGGVDLLARYLANMLDKKSVTFLTIEPHGKRASYLERALDLRPSLEADKTADSAVQWTCEQILELPVAEKARSFFQEGCPGDQLTLKTHQQTQARIFTEAGGPGLPSTEARRMSAYIGSRVRSLSEVIADLTGPLGDRVRRGGAESSVMAHIDDSFRAI